MTHVFLSYQHQYEDAVVSLRDALQSYGFKTWVDIDDMVGSTIESMAKAVEEAAVLVVCMSASYKESKNCQKEVEYAERLHKPIIPIRVETGYRPDGWLGLASGSKMVIDFSAFSDPETFTIKFEQLLKELAAKNVEPDAVDYEGQEGEEEDGGDGGANYEYGEGVEEEGGGSVGEANNEDGEDYQENVDDNEIGQESYGRFMCCACSKKQTTISPEETDGQLY